MGNRTMEIIVYRMYVVSRIFPLKCRRLMAVGIPTVPNSPRKSRSGEFIWLRILNRARKIAFLQGSLSVLAVL